MTASRTRTWNPELGRDRSVLIVDDDPAIRAVLREYLGAWGVVRIAEVTNGSEAVEFMKKNSGVHVVFMDLMMPVMDGVEATRRIRAINSSVVFVVWTAYPGYQGILEAAKRGALFAKKNGKHEDLDQVTEAALTYSTVL